MPLPVPTKNKGSASNKKAQLSFVHQHTKGAAREARRALCVPQHSPKLGLFVGSRAFIFCRHRQRHRSKAVTFWPKAEPFTVFSSLLACLLDCLLACVLACSLTCSHACLAACLLVCLLVCLLACLLVCLLACMLACWLASSLARSFARWLACFLAS